MQKKIPCLAHRFQYHTSPRAATMCCAARDDNRSPVSSKSTLIVTNGDKYLGEVCDNCGSHSVIIRSQAGRFCGPECADAYTLGEMAPAPAKVGLAWIADESLEEMDDALSGSGDQHMMYDDLVAVEHDYTFAIRNGSEEPVGLVTLDDYLPVSGDPDFGELEVSEIRIVVANNQTGKGYGSEALKRLAMEMNNARLKPVLVASVEMDNIASQKAFLKAGFGQHHNKEHNFYLMVKMPD